MNSDRWRRIEELYHAACECHSAARPALLDQACGDDADLRQEVESLLGQSRGDRILDRPLATVAADVLPARERFAPGALVGPYKIMERLGAGGMGEVFRAADTRLGRDVALKVLPPDQLSNPGRRRRFLGEAQAASASNHPNIVTFYDLLSQEHEDILVMEFVEGRTLDQFIGSRGLRLDDALSYASQIAGALAAAHQAGITHRDLKPANVIVTEQGTVKLLDFGLAKFKGLDPESDRTATMDTGDGRIVGTIAYMSPEQAEGRKVDAPSDIFSFGVVLYEMLTGRKAFLRDTTASTVAAISRDGYEPVPGIPENLNTLLTRCLHKDPAKRAQSMADIKVSLEEIREESEHTSATTPGAIRRKLLWASVVAALLALAGAADWILGGSRPEPALLAMPFTTYPGRQENPSFSPDGNQAAFSWNGHIYVKRIGSDRPLQLTNDPAADADPAWSPDGRSVAFLRRQRGQQKKAEILIVPALGGAERQVAEVNYELELSPTWSPDGRWLVVSAPLANVRTHAISLVSAESGAMRQITFPTAGAEGDYRGAISPDGRTLAFNRNRMDLYALSLGSGFTPQGQPRRLTFDNDDVNPAIAWTADGRELIFSSDRAGMMGLWRIAVSGRGEPRRLPAGEDAHFLAIPRLGNRMIYSRRFSDTNIWRVNLSDPQEPPTQLISSTRGELYPQYSPDGKKIAFVSDRGGTSEVWVCDADGSNPAQLTSMNGAFVPRWSPDGRRVAFAARGIFTIGARGGSPRRITSVPEGQYDSSPAWSPDGKWIYFNSNRSVHLKIFKAPAEGGPVVQITKEGGYWPQVSPDGKTIYYSRGVSSVWKTPSNGGQEVQLLDSVEGANFAVNERGIYYIGQPELRFFSFATGKSKLILQLRRPVSNGRQGGLSVSPDERWLLYSQIDHAGSNLMLVENFR